MTPLKILLALLFIAVIFALGKLSIYGKIPGFHRIETFYLSQQDLCGNEGKEEFSKAVSFFTLGLKLQEKKLAEEVKKSCDIVSSHEDFMLVLAKIVQIPHGRFPEEFIVDVGRSSGIEKYSLVMKDGYIFGRVIDVEDSTSRILTVFSSRFFVDAFLLKAGGRVILRGSRDGKIHVFASMGKIELMQGDTLITAGTEFNRPFGLKIAYIDEDGNILPFVGYSDLLYVSIVVPKSSRKRTQGGEEYGKEKK